MLTQDTLRPLGCATPGCGHDHTVLTFHPRCHLRSAIEARYDKTTGGLSINCARCGKLVTEILVAKGASQ